MHVDVVFVDLDGDLLDCDKNDEDGEAKRSRNSIACDCGNNGSIIVLSYMKQSECIFPSMDQ
jgi:hypothetical protein